MVTQSLLIAIAVALIVLIVLGSIGLARLMALARARDAAARDVTQLRALVEALGRGASDHERDIRTDLAIARNESAGGNASGGSQPFAIIARPMKCICAFT